MFLIDSHEYLEIITQDELNETVSAVSRILNP